MVRRPVQYLVRGPDRAPGRRGPDLIACQRAADRLGPGGTVERLDAYGTPTGQIVYTVAEQPDRGGYGGLCATEGCPNAACWPIPTTGSGQPLRYRCGPCCDRATTPDSPGQRPGQSR